MLTLEECLEKLDEINWEPAIDAAGLSLEISNTWDRRFISDICFHTRQNKPISTAQGDLALKIIGRYRAHLEASGISPIALDTLLTSTTPSFRLPAHTSTLVPREVRWVGDSKLVFRCKYNPIIIEDIKKLKGVNHFSSESYPLYSRDWKLWIVDVNSGNFERVMELIRRHRFAFDSAVENFFLECMKSIEMRSTADLDGDTIKVEVRNDDLLNAWLCNLVELDQASV